MEDKPFILTARSANCFRTFKFYPRSNELKKIGGDSTGPCRVMALSPNGVACAYHNGKGIIVRSLQDETVYFEIDRPRTSRMVFSAKGSILAIWEVYRVTKDNPQGSPNMELLNARTGELIKSFYHKKVETWCPQWSSDESICCRMVSNEVHIFANNDFTGAPAAKLVQSNIALYALCPANSHIAIYVPGSKGQPSFVRVHAYPNVSSAVANKAFYKADRCQLFWNNPGTGLLVLTITEVSQDSYYGEQGLNFINVRLGESSIVSLPKGGSVHQVEWHPNGSQFVVTYGNSPAKTTVFNLKCEAIFDFGTGPRNCAYFNPQGNILALAGFGALFGLVEFWDYDQKRKVAQTEMADTTSFSWCADGQHVLTATTAPRLRVNNGFRIWNYKGEKLAAEEEASGCELYEACWKPVTVSLPAPSVCAPVAAKKTTATSAGAAYVPPHLRNKSASERAAVPKLHDNYELPSNQKEANENLSKQALKNKRRREAAKQKRMDEEAGDAKAAAPASGGSGASGRVEFQSTGDPEKDKRVRNVLKKLQAIEQLKAKQAQGASLELNQVEKIKTEDSLRAELEKLTL